MPSRIGHDVRVLRLRLPHVGEDPETAKTFDPANVRSVHGSRLGPVVIAERPDLPKPFAIN